jgi:spoIIIJ-associated protein
MEWVETTGRTLEEARDAALDMLGVDESDAEFLTLTEPRPGLFGRLRGEARVRARVMPTTPPPKRNRGRRPPQRRGSAAQSDETGESQAPPRSPKGRTGGSSKSQSDAEKAASGEPATSGDTAASGESREAPGSGTGRSRSARRRRSRAGTAGSATGGSADSVTSNGSESATTPQRKSRPRKQQSASDGEEEEETVTDTLSLEEQGDLAKRFIEGLVAELGLQATVTARALDDEAVQVAVDGEELGLLVGQGGTTLAAIQELTRTVVQRKTGGRTERILVDVAGYRAKRAEALGKFTRKVVDEVLSSGHEKALEAMSPADRKVVHDAVNEIGGASTRSEGEEPHRYVVISPAASADAEDSFDEQETAGEEG